MVDLGDQYLVSEHLMNIKKTHFKHKKTQQKRECKYNKRSGRNFRTRAQKVQALFRSDNLVPNKLL